MLDNWFFEAWFMTGSIMIALGLSFAFLGGAMVAFEGRRAWHDGFTWTVSLFIIGGLLAPVTYACIALLPFYGIYRAIRNK